MKILSRPSLEGQHADAYLLTIYKLLSYMSQRDKFYSFNNLKLWQPNFTPIRTFHFAEKYGSLALQQMPTDDSVSASFIFDSF